MAKTIYCIQKNKCPLTILHNYLIIYLNGMFVFSYIPEGFRESYGENNLPKAPIPFLKEKEKGAVETGTIPKEGKKYFRYNLNNENLTVGNFVPVQFVQQKMQQER